MSISSADYQELLDEKELTPLTRATFQHGLRVASRREASLAKIGAEGKRAALIQARLQEALREMRKLCGLQFEAAAWNGRSVDRVRGPLLDATNHACLREGRGIAQRLERIRQEAADGGPMQALWLKDHAELIVAVERYGQP
jgi:hypothetical protein